MSDAGQSSSQQDPFAVVGVPPEVFLEICQYALGYNSRFWTKPFSYIRSLDYYSRLTCLRLVCRRWDDLLCGDPQRWTLMTSQQPRQLWKTIITRSSHFPLQVVLLRDCTEQDMIVFMSLVAPNMHRLQSALLKISNKVQRLDLSSILSSPAPILETFLIDVPRPSAWEFSLSGLFQGKAPALTAVLITGNIADEENEVPAFSNGRLERLAIDNRRRSTDDNPQLSSLRRAKVNFILNLLNHSPHLNSLTLKWCELSEGPPAEAVVPRLDGPLTLNKLRRLELIITDDNLLEVILRNIEAPKCLETRIYSWDRLGNDAELLVAHHISTTIQAGKLNPPITLIFLADGSVNVNDVLAYDIQGDVDYEDIQTMGRMFELLPASLRERVETVAISATKWSKLAESFVLHILPVFPCLSEIVFDSQSSVVNLEPLQGGLWTPEGTETHVLPCPQLRRICLCSERVSYDNAWAFSSLIRRRNQFSEQHQLDSAMRVESIHLPPHNDPEAISAMFEGEGVTVEFGVQLDIFALKPENDSFLSPGE